MPEILAMEREKGGTERNVNETHKDSAESGRNMAGGRNLSRAIEREINGRSIWVAGTSDMTGVMMRRWSILWP
jgi:hypothetical protein